MIDTLKLNQLWSDGLEADLNWIWTVKPNEMAVNCEKKARLNKSDYQNCFCNRVVNLSNSLLRDSVLLTQLISRIDWTIEKIMYLIEYLSIYIT